MVAMVLVCLWECVPQIIEMVAKVFVFRERSVKPITTMTASALVSLMQIVPKAFTMGGALFVSLKDNV